MDFFKDFLIINFSQEFGLFWFSPILFIATFLIIYKIIFYKNKRIFMLYTLLLFCFLQNFFIVSIWNSTASSYGFRYLFSLIPVSFLVIFINKEFLSNNLILNYLKYFSVFAFLSTLFFDATQLTTLSLDPVTNSFGYEKVYSQPNYLEGVIRSIFEIEAYRKIIATSFLFIFIVEILINQLKIEIIYEYVYSISENNSDLNLLLIDINELTIYYFFFIVLTAIIFSYQISKHISKFK